MIRITTKDLVGLLTDLAHTAADPASGSTTASVLLHTARGYHGDEPGLSDLLVGTSTDGSMVGHAYAGCYGQGEPMLWSIGDVKAVLAVVKPLAKDKEHAVEVFREGDKIAVAEDPALFGERMSITFAGLAVDEWPHAAVAATLRTIRTRPGGKAPAPAPRTDFAANRLAPLLKIASRRKELLQVFRWHQQLPVHVQIGPAYRAVVAPFRWQDDEPDAGRAPGGDVYPLVLDEPSA